MTIDTKRFRAMIGWLGILLPWIVSILIHRIPESISITWYTNASTVFMIILGAASLLLICYNGYTKFDDLLLTLCGCSGLGICLFPCRMSMENVLVGTFLIDQQISNTIHTCFAILFFALLSYNSLFLFTKGSSNPTENKKKRNIIYRVCGITMIGSFSLLLLPYFYPVIWVVETIALTAFGLSFLTKADIYPWLFCDKN